MGGRRSQPPGPSPTQGSLGLFHQRHDKSRVSLRGPRYAHGVLGIPHREVHDREGLGDPTLGEGRGRWVD
jgi:hypothetical protein